MPYLVHTLTALKDMGATDGSDPVESFQNALNNLEEQGFPLAFVVPEQREPNTRDITTWFVFHGENPKQKSGAAFFQ